MMQDLDISVISHQYFQDLGRAIVSTIIISHASSDQYDTSRARRQSKSIA